MEESRIVTMKSIFEVCLFSPSFFLAPTRVQNTEMGARVRRASCVERAGGVHDVGRELHPPARGPRSRPKDHQKHRQPEGHPELDSQQQVRIFIGKPCLPVISNVGLRDARTGQSLPAPLTVEPWQPASKFRRDRYNHLICVWWGDLPFY